MDAPGVITAVATNPIWVLNTRMSTIKAKSPDHSKSSVAVLLEIVAEEGPLALFKGVVPGLILVTNPAIQYMVFERLRAWTESHRHAAAGKAAGKLTDLDFFWLGLLSKFVASTVTYPLILVKSKVGRARRVHGATCGHARPRRTESRVRPNGSGTRARARPAAPVASQVDGQVAAVHRDLAGHVQDHATGRPGGPFPR